METYWDVLDPAVFADLLALCHSPASLAPLYVPMTFVKAMNEEAIENAAHIWDTILHIERGGLHDAQLTKLAREFKADFLRRKVKDFGSGKVEAEWLAWKSRRFA
jgi:hypothetical protein